MSPPPVSKDDEESRTEVSSLPAEDIARLRAAMSPAPAKAIEAPAKRPAELDLVRKRALLREQAVESYLAAIHKNEVLRVAPPWARRMMAVTTLIAVAAIASTFFIRVEQTARGRGVLRVAGGVQAVTSQTTGVVLELGAKSGQVVASGALLAKIDSAPTKAALLDTEHQIQRAQEDVASFTARRDKEQADRIAALQKSISLLQQRAANQQATVARLETRLKTYDRLVDAGVASALDRGAAENELAAGQRTYLELEEQISSTQLQISSISAELAQELDRRKQEVRKAIDKRDALTFQLAQTEVRSPRDGRIEALVVKVSDSVGVGTPIARIIPEGAPRQVVVFLPEADRAFVQEGSETAIELDQLPVGEFGSLKARVVRVSSDLATDAEIKEALGDTKLTDPTYRIELELEGSDTSERLDKLLRPGSLVTARFVLRERRLITLLFEPLKRFFH